MKIYPKVNTHPEYEAGDMILATAKKYRGIEIHIEPAGRDKYDVETCVPSMREIVDDAIKKHDGVEEITLHVPLHEANIEAFVLRDPNLVSSVLKEVCDIADTTNVWLNVLYHTELRGDNAAIVFGNWIKRFLDEIKGHKVRILLENPVQYGGDACAAFVLCDEFFNEQLKACLDVTHLQVRAHKNRMDENEYIRKSIKTSIRKHKPNEVIRQIHFAYAANGDGYIDKNTHGVAHTTYEELRNDCDLLKEFGLEKANFVTEVQEPDKNYKDRVCQIKEIEMLEKYKANIDG